MKKANNQSLFETMAVPKAVRKMAMPTVMGQLVILLYNLADTFFVGKTNNPYMVAGAALILPIFNISSSIACIAGVGGGSMVSRLLGTGNYSEAKKVYSFCVYFSILAAGLFSLATGFFMRPLLKALGAGSETFAYARSYALWVIVFGGIPTIVSNVFANLVRSTGESEKAGFGITLGGILNIVLDPLFMFVIMPAGQEITGVGIATCISNCISCTYFIFVIRKLGTDSVLKLQPAQQFPEQHSVQMIFSVGVPAAVTTFLFDMDYVVLDRLMSGYNDVALAAIGIVLKAERLPLNVGVGICQAMVPLVAYNFANKNYKRMHSISRFSLLCGIVCAIISITLYEIFAPQVIRFFIGNAETVAMGTRFLRARCLATVFMFMSFYHVHLFNGYARGKEALLLGVVRWVGFNIPMLFLMNRLFGMYGLVWSQLIADILTVVFSLAVHRRFIRRNADFAAALRPVEP